MADDMDELYPYRRSIVDELFIKTADDNYVTARWCYANGFDVDFFWLAVHALEKYLKAVLLLNGRSGKEATVTGKKWNYRHDIVLLYADVKPLAPELLPAALTCPSEIDDPLWHDATPEQFVQRLYDMGHAGNRYQLTGYVLREGDLFKLDQLVFAVRRLCGPLEAHFLGKKRASLPDESFRQRMIKDHPVSANLHSRLEETMKGKRGHEAQHALLNYNFPFAPKDYEHTTMRGLLVSSSNPVLLRRVIEPLDAGKPEYDKHADALWQWTKDNIHLPKEFIEAYEAERAKRRTAAKNKSNS